MKAFLLEKWCKFMNHELTWRYGTGIRIHWCEKCNLVHDIERV